MNEKKRLALNKYAYPVAVSLLVTSLCWFFYSASVDTEKGTFVQRSGSVLILAGVIVEYFLYYVSYEEGIEQAMEKKHSFMKYVTHIYIISGTIIWGYGDLIFTHYIY